MRTTLAGAARLVLGLQVAGALGCFYATLDHDELDAKAAGAPPAEAPAEADAGDYTTSLETPPIELNLEGTTTRDSCVATTAQARAVLEENCSGCHAPPAAMGGFNTILDFPRLVTETSSTLRDPVTDEPVPLVVPGDPDGSRLYRRAALGEMPPQRDASLPPLPRPSIADVSILRQWIESCLPEVPAAQTAAPALDAGVP